MRQLHFVFIAVLLAKYLTIPRVRDLGIFGLMQHLGVKSSAFVLVGMVLVNHSHSGNKVRPKSVVKTLFTQSFQGNRSLKNFVTLLVYYHNNLSHLATFIHIMTGVGTQRIFTIEASLAWVCQAFVQIDALVSV